MKKYLFLLLFFLFSRSYAINSALEFANANCPAGPLLIKGWTHGGDGSFVPNGGTCDGRLDASGARVKGQPIYCYQYSTGCTCENGKTFGGDLAVNGEPLRGCIKDPTASSSSSSSSSNSLPCDMTETCSSSSSSSSSCPSGTVGSYINNEFTCVPDLNSSSSAAASSADSASSTASSTPSSSSTSSAPSSSGSGGDNTGGGSNSSAAAVAMQNCELTFGSGKCSILSSQSPCPNTYTSGGVTFCVASSGTGSGTGSSSGNASSTPSTANPSNCSSAPACAGDAIQCAILKQAWINNCDGINSKVDINAAGDNTDIQAQFDNLINSTPVQTEADGSIKDIHKNIDIGNMSDVQDLMNSLDSAASTPSHGVCPAPRHIQLHLGSFQLSYQPFCDFATQVSYLVLFFFSLSGVLIIYRTVERA